MKSFSFCSIIVMLCSVILVFPGQGSSPANRVRKNAAVKMDNLHFTTDNPNDNIALVTADFDVISESESTGEIQITVDGSKPVNNRLMIKKGASHYYVAFMLKYPETSKDLHLHSATAKLTVNGITKDMLQQDFAINNTVLAGKFR